MIGKLAAVLRAAKLDPTAEEIADALWLAALAGPMAGIGSAQPQRTTPSSDDVSASEAKSMTSPRDRGSAARETETTAGSGALSGELHQAMGRASVVPMGKRGVPVASPTASALPGALDIARALRPLKRRVPSKVHYEVDEQATARRMAEQAPEPIVLRPLRTRWLNLTLLVDEGPSMAIWQQTARELQTLLEGHGAFRRVQRRGFIAVGAGEPRLFARSGRGAVRAVGAKELVDPTGRQLLLIVSDCVSAAWHDGRMGALIGEWARYGPVGLLQTLPARLWHRTALGTAMPVRLRAPCPAAANCQLLIEKDEWWSPEDAAGGTLVPLPVFSLERASLEAWSTMIAGGASEGVGGVALQAGGASDDGHRQSGEHDDGAAEGLDARARVARFRATASLKAQKLATCFAASHYLSLPVMRQIRRTMLPDAALGHLAEVFLGGLLREETEGDAGDPEYVRYNFVEGIRELLLESSDEQSIRSVLTAVSDYVTVHLGHKTSFRAILADPTGDGSEVIPEDEISFARIGADILRRLGGEYEQLAGRIDSRLHDAVSPGVQRFEPSHSSGDASVKAKLVEYAREYESVRAHSPPSSLRTARLDRLFSDIRAFAAERRVRAAAALDAFHRDAEGMRIVALAILMADPDPIGFEVGRGAIAGSRSAFEQYYALLVTMQFLPRLSLAQKIALRKVIVHQRSGAPGCYILPDSDRWVLGEQILDVLDASHQILLILDGAELTLDAIKRAIPSKYSHRTVLRLTDYGVRPSSSGELPDWRMWRAALDRYVDHARASIWLEGLQPHIYVVGHAPLPVLVHLGLELPRQVAVTMYDFPGSDAGSSLHLDLDISPEAADGNVSRPAAPSPGTVHRRVAVYVGVERPMAADEIRAFFAERDETPADLFEIRFDEQQASFGPAVRSTLAAIQLDSGFARAATLGDRLALFIDGPPTLAFLVGRALDTRRFRDIWVPFAGGQRYVQAFEYENSTQDDDAEADDAVAVLSRYWPIGLEVSEAMAAWTRCLVEVSGFERMRRTLRMVSDQVAAAQERMPAEPIARFPCGQEIETAHIEYVDAQREYLGRLDAWIERHRDPLSTLMRRQPLLAASSDIDEAPRMAAFSYERLMNVDGTKRLFQCGSPDNVAWISKVAACLGLGPDKPRERPLRVRATQRIIWALKREKGDVRLRQKAAVALRDPEEAIPYEALAFGDRLRGLRHKRHLKQGDLADAARLSVEAISAYEHGRSRPTWSTVQALARGLGTTVEALLGGLPPHATGMVEKRSPQGGAAESRSIGDAKKGSAKGAKASTKGRAKKVVRSK